MRRISSIWAVAALLLAGVITFRQGISAQPAASFAGDFDPGKALAVVYGSQNWSDPRLREYADFPQGRAFVAPAFDAAFNEQGVEKHIVLATLTPRPAAAYNCNACSPLLGGAVFRKEGGRWSAESVGLIIDSTGAHRSLALVRIGPDRHAVLHETTTVSGGNEARSAGFIFAVGATLASRLAVHSPDNGSSPGPGACGAPSGQGLSLAVDTAVTGAAYQDAVVEARWNDGTCSEVALPDGRRGGLWNGAACRRTTRYRMRADRYELLAVERNECGPVQRVTVSWDG